ncbi:3-keto-disaccharide hydrolase [Rhodocaloribacter sp.]
MTLRLPMLALAVLFAAGCGARPDVPAPDNTLTEAERAGGWRLLFDGATTNGWRGYNRPDFPAGRWTVEAGTLASLPSDTSTVPADLVTEETFANFELRFDFKVSPGGNSGVFYLVRETPGLAMWEVAPEYQVLDDSAYLAPGTMDMHGHLTGDNYDLHASSVQANRPAGAWNEGRIIVRDGRVEHWLNGQRTVAYELWTPEWEALVARSKFAEHPAYGQARQGRIGLQDHGHRVWFRNLKIRSF